MAKLGRDYRGAPTTVNVSVKDSEIFSELLPDSIAALVATMELLSRYGHLRSMFRCLWTSAPPLARIVRIHNSALKAKTARSAGSGPWP